MTSRLASVLVLTVVLGPGAASVARGEDPPAGGPPPATPPAEAPPAPPTVEDLLRDLGDAKAVVRRLDAAVAAKDCPDPKLLPALVRCVRDEHPDVRRAAILALGARVGDEQRRKAADAVGDRLKATAGKVEHEAERLDAVRALHDLAQPSTIDVLLDGIETGTSVSEAEARCLAVGNVPSPKAIEALIAFMSKRHRDGSGTRAAAVRGLTYATGERGGNDPDQWRAWWKDHEKTFDFDAAALRREKERQAKEERDARRDGKKRKKDGS